MKTVYNANGLRTFYIELPEWANGDTNHPRIKKIFDKLIEEYRSKNRDPNLMQKKY